MKKSAIMQLLLDDPCNPYMFVYIREYCSKINETAHLDEKLEKKLNDGEIYDLYVKYKNAIEELNLIDCETHFKYGFKFGIRLGIEIAQDEE